MVGYCKVITDTSQATGVINPLDPTLYLYDYYIILEFGTPSMNVSAVSSTKVAESLPS